MPAGLYLHIPFCLRKCHYCDFYSIPFAEDLAHRYVRALKREIQSIFGELPWSEMRFSTLYVGGGTPTVLSSDQLMCILENCLGLFSFDDEIECTVEANPESLNEEKLRALLQAGVNRLSLGVQSFHDDELRQLGRVHSARRAIGTYRLARNVGFANIGIDLISAIPGQSFERWRRNLEKAVALEPEHISAYSLTIEDGTILAREISSGKVSRVAEELEAEMFELTIDYLEDNGYEHYEISNFARPGFRSRHNQLYWDHHPYLGLGPSAHSFTGNRRWKRVGNVKEYIERVERGETTITEEELLLQRNLMAETIFLALRKMEGLNTVQFQKQYEIDIEQRYSDVIKKYIDMNMLEWDGPYLRCTRKGLLVANSICAEFM
jgi:oxygen-independent coproporphyrinogen-3 oxidase